MVGGHSEKQTQAKTNTKTKQIDTKFQSERERCIDRGPAWVMAICAFTMDAMHCGFLAATPLFFPALMETTELNISVVSWISSAQYCVMLCFAPFYNRIFDYLPFRAVMVGGTLITVGSVIASAFTSNFFVFFTLYTLIACIGAGITYVRIVGTTAEYFNRYRIFVMAICTSGIGFGTFIYCAIDAYLMETYTWRTTIIFNALFHLHTIPLGMILKPLPSETKPEAVDVLVPSEAVPAGSSLAVEAVSSDQLNYRDKHTAVERENSEHLPSKIQRMRVLIEFVRAIVGPDHITLEPMKSLIDIGPEMVQQLQNAAEECIPQGETTNIPVYIPVILLISESVRLTGPSESSRLDRSGHVRTTAGMPDMFGGARAVALIKEREHGMLRQKVHNLIKNSVQKVAEVTDQLSSCGALVNPSPVMAVVGAENICAEATELSTTDVDPVSDYVVLHYGEATPRAGKIPLVHYREVLTSAFSSIWKTGIGHSTPRTGPYAAQLADDYAKSAPAIPRLVTRFGTEHAVTRRLSQSSALHTPKRTVGASTISDRSVGNLLLSTTSIKAAEKDLIGLSKEKKISRFVLKDPYFLTYVFTRALGGMADAVILSHVSNFGLFLGYSTQGAAHMLSMIGLSSMGTRLFVGFAGHFLDRTGISTLLAVCCSLLTVGISVWPFLSAYPVLICASILYGIVSSPCFAFSTGMTVFILGPELYEEGIPYCFQFESFGYLVGGPIGGLLFEAVGDYSACFLYAAGNTLLAALILFVHVFLRLKCCAKKQVDKHGDHSLSTIEESG
ncbi:unnamed protein product [Calicophoron daubneyi]|uniref:Uncharacterized protein n=1 Tax=Calicophoron daubneyi TaxID=300641 RepID=A0AAV2TTF2_CALDB